MVSYGHVLGDKHIQRWSRWSHWETPRAPRSLQDTGRSGLDYLLPSIALESFIWKGIIVLIDISTYFSVAIKYPEGEDCVLYLLELLPPL